MKTSRNIKVGIPPIRLPVAPPGKVMLSIKEYNRKKQKLTDKYEIKKHELETK